jgi:predicted permease
MEIITTLMPLFILIALGWFARRYGFLPSGFLGPANRLVFYLAVPALIFRAISKSDFTAQFQFQVLTATLVPILAVFSLAWGIGCLRWIPRPRTGPFIQCSIHGNLGYFALPVSHYLLGDEGFIVASILAGFVMILQNLSAVWALQAWGNQSGSKKVGLTAFRGIITNPVILSALGGIFFSLLPITLPGFVDRTLEMLSNFALPMALLIIGASLSFQIQRSWIMPVLAANALKLIILPALGFLMFRAFSLDSSQYGPSLIILATPTATVTYVMAREMTGNGDFAASAISTSTILCVLTFTLWLHLAL